MSINVRELRIGNYVTYHGGEDGDMPHKVDGVDIALMEEKESYSAIHSPIPLIPEILEKCGFVDCTCKGWRLEGKMLFHLNSDMSFDSWGKVASLHQLQNLYFALAGEEPKVKL